MSRFKCEVIEAKVIPHPNADFLDIVKVGDFNSVIIKGHVETGDKVIYIPQWAILPQPIIKFLGLEGKLAGPDRNIVKPMKLRGVLSQGLIMPLLDGSRHVGDDVSDDLGIRKHEYKPSSDLLGKVITGKYSDYALNYDFDDIKHKPDIFEKGEEVVITEKLHGKCMVIGGLPHTAFIDPRFFVSSKGLMKEGVVFDLEQFGNEYVDIVSSMGIFQKIVNVMGEYEYPMYIFAELYGSQKLKYGLPQGMKGLRVFDIARKLPDGSVDFMDYDMLKQVVEDMRLNMVPELYRGPYYGGVIQEFTYGFETVSGTKAHDREGIVIKPTEERFLPLYGRVIMKSVSDKYVLEEDGTEGN